MKYFEQLKDAMEMLAQNPKVKFLGQAVAVPGTAMTNTLKNVPENQKIEFPVAEELQMGVSIGLACTGYIPVSIYPRWNFLLLAVNQLVNHLDKLSKMTGGQINPKVIVRTGIGSERPLHPQHQHIGDYTEAFRYMCPNIDVIRLDEPGQIIPAYELALHRSDGKSTLLVEWGDFYSEK